MKSNYNNGVRPFVKRIENNGYLCKTEVREENRRLDAVCKKGNSDVSIEVKNNLNDATSRRSKSQIKDMKKTANKKNKAFVLHLAQENCSIGMNPKGKQFVNENKLVRCKITKIGF